MEEKKEKKSCNEWKNIAFQIFVLFPLWFSHCLFLEKKHKQREILLFRALKQLNKITFISVVGFDDRIEKYFEHGNSSNEAKDSNLMISSNTIKCSIISRTREKVAFEI